MNIQHYKQRLLDLERTLSARIGQAADQGRGEFIDSAHDVGDASVADEVASEGFTEAEHNSDVLQQVRDALDRVADGTFGTCIVDGGPIEEQRLEAVPWTPYCLKHAQRLEAAASPRMPRVYQRPIPQFPDWFCKQDQIMTHAVVWIDHKEARIFHVHPEAADESRILSPQHHVHPHPKGRGAP